MKEVVWYQKYRPKTVKDCILPKEMKSTFENFVKSKEFPSMILSGNTGMGKTTIAKAVLNELGFDSYFINASLKGNIDTLRNEITEYASTVSFTEGRKFVILDEADRLTIATQESLRAFIEEFSSNCGFILTCNNLNRIIDPLKGRFSVINFSIPKEEKVDLMKQTIMMCMDILNKENITFDQKAVALLVKTSYPNIRAILSALQRHSHTGHIDSGVVSTIRDENFDELSNILKVKDWNAARKWVGENNDLDWGLMLGKMEQVLMTKVVDASKPMLLILLNKYDFQHGFVTNAEINTASLLTEIMSEIEFIR